jgi:hypothetical protein
MKLKQVATMQAGKTREGKTRAGKTRAGMRQAEAERTRGWRRNRIAKHLKERKGQGRNNWFMMKRTVMVYDPLVNARKLPWYVICRFASGTYLPAPEQGRRMD